MVTFSVLLKEQGICLNALEDCWKCFFATRHTRILQISVQRALSGAALAVNPQIFHNAQTAPTVLQISIYRLTSNTHVRYSLPVHMRIR